MELPVDLQRRYQAARCAKPTVVDARQAQRALSGLIGRLDGPALWQAATAVFEAALGSGHEAMVAAYFDEIVQHEPLAEISRTLACAPERQVLFVARRPYFSIVREALHLAEHGWRCHLIHLEPFPSDLESCLTAAFAHRWRIPSCVLLLEAVIRRLQRGVVLVQTWQFDYALTVAVQRAAVGVPVVAEFVDITSMIGDIDTLSQRFDRERVELDVAMEGVICREADAVLTRFGPAAWPLLEAKHGPLTRFCQFLPYPSPKYAPIDPAYTPRANGRLRAVYAGGLGGIPKSAERPAYPGHTLRVVFQTLLEQGIDVDVFHDPYRPIAHDPVVQQTYGELRTRYPGFRVFDGVAPDRLPSRLAGYDLGLMAFIVPPSGYGTRPELVKHGIGTKMFPYLEAGLPVLVTAEFEAAAELVRSHELGLVVESSRLREVDTRATVENLLNWRIGVEQYVNSHGMHRQIARLDTLFGELLATRRAACGKSTG